MRKRLFNILFWSDFQDNGYLIQSLSKGINYNNMIKEYEIIGVFYFPWSNVLISVDNLYITAFFRLVFVLFVKE